MNDFQIFNSEELERIKAIEDNTKNSYMGFIYILEYGKNVKIGYSQKPSSWIKSLKKQAEYGDLKLGSIAISKPHTNYRENEKLLHQYFKQYNILGTELFSITLKQTLSDLPDELKFLDESERLTQETEQTLEGFKKLISWLWGIESPKIEPNCKISVKINEKPLNEPVFQPPYKKGSYIMDETIEKIKPFLVDYVKEITQPSRNGGKNQYICPLCGSGTGSHHSGAFTVYPDNNRYYCFACDAKGDIFELYGAMNHISDKGTVIRELKSKYGIFSASQPIRQKKQSEKSIQPKIEKNYTTLFEIAEMHLNETDYLTNRGISMQTQRKFHCGYIADFTYKDKQSTPAVIIPTSATSFMWRSTTENIKQKRGTVRLFNIDKSYKL